MRKLDLAADLYYPKWRPSIDDAMISLARLECFKMDSFMVSILIFPSALTGGFSLKLCRMAEVSASGSCGGTQSPISVLLASSFYTKRPSMFTIFGILIGLWFVYVNQSHTSSIIACYVSSFFVFYNKIPATDATTLVILTFLLLHNVWMMNPHILWISDLMIIL